jgi:hypothetical protein
MPAPAERPSALLEIQRWLASVILTGRTPPAVDLGERLLASSPAVAVDRLGAHVGGYPARLREALHEAFPAVARSVGETAFAELVGRYLPKVPAGIYNLSETGSALPEFVKDDSLGRERPYLSDLACLDWAVHVAFHAHERAPLGADAFAGWKLERFARAVLEIQPSLTIVHSGWSILGVWKHRYAKPGEPIPAVAARAETLIVHREGFRVICRPAEEGEAETLTALRSGRSLGQAMDELAKTRIRAESVSDAFARWMHAGLVTGCRLA